MKDIKIGLVGIGKLGSAMMKQWDDFDLSIGAFHPDHSKAKTFITSYQNAYVLGEEDINKLDILVMAIPATEIIPFLDRLEADNTLTETYVINMATTLYTREIKDRFPNLPAYGVKYMGQGRDLLENGNGLFISESNLPAPVAKLFGYIGEWREDSEETLTEVNKLATYYAVKVAHEIETDFTRRGFPPEYIQRALTSLAPGVIRSYNEGTLGHFAKEIVKELEKEKNQHR